MPNKNETVTRPAKLFEAGEYTDKGITVTEADLDEYVKNTQSATLRIEHAGSPFDGALGVAKDLYRKGRELFASIEFPRCAWELVDAAGAKKLSVGIDVVKKCIQEVSLVRDPRVASAAIFSGGPVLMGGLIEMGWDGMAAHEIERAISKTISGEDYGVEVGPLHEASAVVTQNGKSHSYPFSVENGNVVLGEPTEVRQVWQPVPAFTSQNKGPERRSEKMPEFTEDQVKQIAETAAKAAADAVEAKFSGKLDELSTTIGALTDENKALRVEFAQKEAEGTVARLLSEGKIHPEAVEFAKGMILAGGEAATTFVQFMDKQGRVENLPDPEADAEPTVEALSADEKRIFAAVGVDPAKVIEMRKGKVA